MHTIFNLRVLSWAPATGNIQDGGIYYEIYGKLLTLILSELS